MVLLLLLHDCANGSNGRLVLRAKRLDLLLQVNQNDALNSNGGCCHGIATEKCRNHTEHKAANATQSIAAATPQTPPLQLGLEDCTMVLLVQFELSKLRQH